MRYIETTATILVLSREFFCLFNFYLVNSLLYIPSQNTTTTMADEEEQPMSTEVTIPAPAALAGDYGVMPSGTKGGEGNFFRAALRVDEESGEQTMTFTHKTCFVPSGKDVPFSGMWLDESHVFSGTWEVTSEEKTQEGEAAGEGKSGDGGDEEGKSEAPVLVTDADVAAAFAEGDVDGSGGLGFEEIQAIEEKFGLPLAISSNAADWADGKISLAEFTGMLSANGNIAPPPPPPTAVLTLKSATKQMMGVEDGAFVQQDQPYSKYSWSFRMAGPDYNTLELFDSNYPVSLSKSRFVSGDAIELKYCDLKLIKE
jgi:hypothetical protein